MAVLAAGAVFVMFAGAAQAQETDAGVKLKLAGFGEGARDFGATGAPETQETFVEINPEAHWQMSENFAAHTRLQGFFSSGDVVLNEDNEPVSTDRYAALRELWLEYGGITSYPGEVLRLGLQRLKEPDGLWWDRDIESLRWIFDTTLFQAHIGAGEQFNHYRSDDVELPPSQRDRAYAFASLSREWMPAHRGGLRFTYAQDHGEPPPVGSTADASSKLAERQFAWIGARAENGFYEYRRVSFLTYWIEATTLLGTQDTTQTDDQPGPNGEPPTNQVLATTSRDVVALAGDAGLRLRFPGPSQFQLGAAYAHAQGGRSDGTSNTYVQTGLHSNRSRFTGTRSLLHRFNEAYQADFTNIRVASAFMSLPLEHVDASLVFHRFTRDNPSTSVSTDGVDVQPTGSSDDLGHGWDVVTAYYFEHLGSAVHGAADSEEDTRSNLRLRASVFEPGAAYDSALKDQYRVMLEAGLWF
jgi:alginate production protein